MATPCYTHRSPRGSSLQWDPLQKSAPHASPQARRVALGLTCSVPTTPARSFGQAQAINPTNKKLDLTQKSLKLLTTKNGLPKKAHINVQEVRSETLTLPNPNSTRPERAPAAASAAPPSPRSECAAPRAPPRLGNAIASDLSNPTSCNHPVLFASPQFKK